MVHFSRGFPVMAWPMMEWVLEHHYRHLFHVAPQMEHSVIVLGPWRLPLTPPHGTDWSVTIPVCGCSACQCGSPQYGRHIELG